MNGIVSLNPNGIEQRHQVNFDPVEGFLNLFGVCDEFPDPN
jgi:hypothetical protein